MVVPRRFSREGGAYKRNLSSSCACCGSGLSTDQTCANNGICVGLCRDMVAPPGGFERAERVEKGECVLRL